MELHKSEKNMKNNKPPKHLIELGNLFNISLQVIQSFIKFYTGLSKRIEPW